MALPTGCSKRAAKATEPPAVAASAPAELVLLILPGVDFRVRITADRPRHEGEAVDGLFDNDAGSITLWAGLTGRRRLHVLLHEWWHVKRYYLGAAESDAETDCDTAAACMASLLAQLEAFGGTAAIEALQPSA